MKKFLSGLCATFLAASFAVGSAVPVNAAPIVVPMASPAKSNVIQIQSQQHFPGEQRWIRRGNRGEFRRDRREFRREVRRDRREFRRDRRDFRRDGRYGWYKGHRGYRGYRRGYREYNGYWFPAAAFITGAIIGGALNNSGGGGSHVEWCYDRWRSYRAYDNSYQPYNGSRQQCYSPYN
ncbi:MAG: BA14K family protein [Pseudaminobacter sp.]|nr:BA14K family protein [Pseudaminobacter sp.]